MFGLFLALTIVSGIITIIFGITTMICWLSEVERKYGESEEEAEKRSNIFFSKIKKVLIVAGSIFLPALLLTVGLAPELEENASQCYSCREQVEQCKSKLNDVQLKEFKKITKEDNNNNW